MNAEKLALQNIATLALLAIERVATEDPENAATIISGLNLRVALWGTPPTGDTPVQAKQRELWNDLQLDHDMSKQAFSAAAIHWLTSEQR